MGKNGSEEGWAFFSTLGGIRPYIALVSLESLDMIYCLECNDTAFHLNILRFCGED